ncbi:MAG: tetratricopeptide repeat protein, partial [Enterovibrio sp.]
DKGHVSAQVFFGGLYALGQGVAQDDKQAVSLAREAAEQGNINAQFSLGESYFIGKGVKRDFKQAYSWLSVAAANGHPTAADMRDVAAKQLSPTDLADAQKIADRYFERYQPKK